MRHAPSVPYSRPTTPVSSLKPANHWPRTLPAQMAFPGGRTGGFQVQNLGLLPPSRLPLVVSSCRLAFPFSFFRSFSLCVILVVRCCVTDWIDRHFFTLLFYFLSFLIHRFTTHPAGLNPFTSATHLQYNPTSDLPTPYLRSNDINHPPPLPPSLRYLPVYRVRPSSFKQK